MSKRIAISMLITIVLVPVFFLGRYWFLNRTVYRDCKEFVSQELYIVQKEFGLMDTAAFPRPTFAFLAQYRAEGDEYHPYDMRLALVETRNQKSIMTEVIQYSPKTYTKQIYCDTITNDSIFESLKKQLIQKSILELGCPDIYKHSICFGCSKYEVYIKSNDSWNAFIFSGETESFPFGLRKEYKVINELFDNNNIFRHFNRLSSSNEQ